MRYKTFLLTLLSLMLLAGMALGYPDLTEPHDFGADASDYDKSKGSIPLSGDIPNPPVSW